MANTYTQFHIQFVFAVKFRSSLIQDEWKERLHQYITGIVQKNDHKMLQINTMPDHLHMLIGLRPHQGASSLIQNVKAESSKWINRQSLSRTRFAWQNGFGAFSYSKSHVPNVIRYIQNQEQHHQKIEFLDEYKRMLNLFDVEYDDRYIFKTPV